MTINKLSPIIAITREETRQELCSRIEKKNISKREIKDTLNNYLNIKRFNWDQKRFKTPFHCDPTHKTRQFLKCLKGNMRSNIYTIQDQQEFHQNMFDTHRQGFEHPFTRDRLNQDYKNLQQDKAKLNYYKDVLNYLEMLDIKNDQVVFTSNKQPYV